MIRSHNAHTCLTLFAALTLGCGGASIKLPFHDHLDSGSEVTPDAGVVMVPPPLPPNPNFQVRIIVVHPKVDAGSPPMAGSAVEQTEYRALTCKVGIQCSLPPVAAIAGATAYTSDPPLPAGFVFDPTTGGITGMPLEPLETTTYAIRGVVSEGQVTLLVTITVTRPAPEAIEYSPDEISIVVGTEVTGVKPNVTGGIPTKFTIAPPLPNGLRLDSASGILAGTPAVSFSATAFIITGENESGSVSCAVKVQAIDRVPRMDLGAAW